MQFIHGKKRTSLENMIEINQSIDNDTLKINELNNRIEQQEDIIEESSGIANALSQISEKINEIGTLATHEAKTIDIAVEHFCKRLGYASKVSIGLESRIVITSKTAFALEGIVSSIWEAIKAAFRKLGEWIKAAWEAIFGKSKSVTQKTEAVAQQRKEVNNALPTQKQDALVTQINENQKNNLSNDGNQKPPEKDSTKFPLAKALGSTYSDKLIRFFRTEDGLHCFTPQEIEKRSHVLLEGLSSGEFKQMYVESTNARGEIKTLIEDYFDALDRVSEAYTTGKREQIDSCLDTFKKISLNSQKEMQIGKEGDVITFPFDTNIVIAGKNNAVLHPVKAPFKEARSFIILLAPPSSLKDKILDTVKKIDENEQLGEIKKGRERIADLIKLIDKRIEKSMGVYNLNVKGVNDSDLKKEAMAFGTIITSETMKFKNGFKAMNDCMFMSLEIAINTMNALLEYVRVSDKMILNQDAELVHKL